MEDTPCATIKLPINAQFAPKKDITAYELALLLPYIINTPLFEEDWDNLGKATRHLRREETD